MFETRNVWSKSALRPGSIIQGGKGCKIRTSKTAALNVFGTCTVLGLPV